MFSLRRRLAAAAVPQARVWPSDISLGGSTKVPLTGANEAVFSKVEGRRVTAPCHLQRFGDSSGALWCPVHQGQALPGAGRCQHHTRLVDYSLRSKHVDINAHAEVGIWAGIGPAIDTYQPGAHYFTAVHVHVRPDAGGPKVIDRSYASLTVKDDERTQNITPPVAFAYLNAVREGRTSSLAEVACPHCGEHHEDVGDEHLVPHRHHLCSHCGSPFTTPEPVIGNPLIRLTRTHPSTQVDGGAIRLKSANHDVQIWPTTPAIAWVANRDQSLGVHVHAYQNGKRVIDDSVEEVYLDGERFDQDELWKSMLRAACSRKFGEQKKRQFVDLDH